MTQQHMVKGASFVTLERLLRSVDGWPHVVLGPALLAFAAELGNAIGVGTTVLRVFLVLLTLYGVLVLFALRRGGAPSWLAAVAIAANTAIVLSVAVSAGFSELTSPGTVVHVLLLLSGLVMTGMLVLLARARRGACAGQCQL